MIRAAVLTAVVLLSIGLIFAATHPRLPSENEPLCFYSNQRRFDLKQLFLTSIRKAKESISLQIYDLSDPDLIHLLGKKWNEGLSIRIFCDKKCVKKIEHVVPTYPIKTSGLMHRKILVIDGETTYLGSANMTPSSLKMHSNLVVGIKSREVARFFQDGLFNQGIFFVEDSAVAAYLLPEGGESARAALIEAIESADREVFVAMFTLTEPLLCAALVDAKIRGVHVTIAIDRNTASGASKKAVAALQGAGIPVHLGRGPALLHHKFCLIDGTTLFFGSANWTKSAFTKNQDFLVSIEGLSKKKARWMSLLTKRVESFAERR